MEKREREEKGELRIGWRGRKFEAEREGRSRKVRREETGSKEDRRKGGRGGWKGGK